MHKTKTFLAASLTLALAACGSNGVKSDKVAAAPLNNDDLYEVHHEGRLYVFDDQKTYREFLEVGETSFRQTFIGGGPDGQTLVFGVTGDDKKKHYSEIAAYNLYHGELKPAEDFYGEMRAEGRIYVFDRLADMEAVRQTGEAPLRYTEIGTGPNGETVVYVLRGENKKQKPVALQEAFKSRYNLM